MLSTNFRIQNGSPAKNGAKMLTLMITRCACAYIHQNCLQFAETKCGCRPWHVPSEDGAKMCFVVGNICFQQVIVGAILVN